MAKEIEKKEWDLTPLLISDEDPKIEDILKENKKKLTVQVD